MDALPPGADLNLIPIQAPPPGETTDFNRKPLTNIAVIVVSITVFLELLFLSIRIFTKIKAKIGILFDDWCAIIAFVLSIGMSTTIILGRDFGKHTWDVSVAQAIEPRGAKIIFAQVMLTGPANYMGKLSLLALFHRIFGHMTRVRYSLYAAGVVGLIIPIMTPLDAIVCSPPKGTAWGTPNPNCAKSYKYGIPQGMASLLIDLYIMILPIPIIAKLNLARKKKIGIMFIFLLGSLAVIADIIVFKFRVDMQRGYDVLYAGVVILVCSVVETGISVACSSMPTIAKFSRLAIWETGYFLTLRSLLRSSTRRSKASSNKSRQSFENEEKPAPKKPDPYSLNMPTYTNASVTRLTVDNYEDLELGDRGGTLAQPEVVYNPDRHGRFVGRGIQKSVSVEQSHETTDPQNPRHMV